MKRVLTNMIFSLISAGLFLYVSAGFLAQTQFIAAAEMEKGYRWQKAEEKYDLAVKICPLNAEYYAGYGDFLTRRSKYAKDKDLTLEKTAELYKKAIFLNKRNAEYWYGLGRVYMMQGAGWAVDSFKEAIALDPHNFRLNYLIGYDLFEKWDSLDENDRGFAMARMRYVLEQRPGYASYVYPAVMYYTDDFNIVREITPDTLAAYENLYKFIQYNNLWQYRKEVSDRLRSYGKAEGLEEIQPSGKSPSFKKEKWIGKSADGKNTYEGGNMYWTGTVGTLVDVPQGESAITITAKGSPADGVFPYMIVELDGEEVGEIFIESMDWQKYSFRIKGDAGIKLLSVTFANDGGNKEKGEDRNLYLGEVTINGFPLSRE